MLAVMGWTFAGASQETVMYIPGWHRCGRGEDAAFRAVQAVFPEAEVSVRTWDGNCRWKKARQSADSEAAKLAAELKAMPESKRRRLTLVGHSLGARIVIRALACLGEEDVKVKQAVVLAAAIPCDDSHLETFAAASAEPALVVCNPDDTMLKYGYRPFGGEGEKALGAVGPARSIANCAVRTVTPDSIRSTPLDALWAKVGWFRLIAAHYAPFYIRQIGVNGEKP